MSKPIQSKEQLRKIEERNKKRRANTFLNKGFKSIQEQERESPRKETINRLPPTKEEIKEIEEKCNSAFKRFE